MKKQNEEQSMHEVTVRDYRRGSDKTIFEDLVGSEAARATEEALEAAKKKIDDALQVKQNAKREAAQKAAQEKALAEIRKQEALQAASKRQAINEVKKIITDALGTENPTADDLLIMIAILVKLMPGVAGFPGVVAGKHFREYLEVFRDQK